MLPEIEQLLILQDKDQTIRRLHADLKRLPQEEERAKQKLATDQVAVQAAKTRVQENEVTMKNLELQILTRRDTIAKLKVQQFETRKNDEFQALGHEVVRYEKEVTGLEDQELELMEKGEKLRSDLGAALTGLAATEKLVEEELRKLQERQIQVGGQMKDFETKRKEQAGKIDEDLLETYDRIFKHRGDLAVAPIVGNICRGCNMKVAPSVLVAAKGEKQMVNCSNCGRIVYMQWD